MRVLKIAIITFILICTFSISNPLKSPSWPDLVVKADPIGDIGSLKEVIKEEARVRQGQWRFESNQGSVKVVVWATVIGVDRGDLERIEPPVILKSGDWYRSAGQSTIGSAINFNLGLDVGDNFILDDKVIKVVGIMEQTGTQLDRVIFVNFSDAPRKFPIFSYLTLKSGQQEYIKSELAAQYLKIVEDPYSLRGDELKVLITKIVIAILSSVFCAWSSLRAGKYHKLTRSTLAGPIIGTLLALPTMLIFNHIMSPRGFAIFRIFWLPIALANGLPLATMLAFRGKTLVNHILCH
jgi:hypothetical protein